MSCFTQCEWPKTDLEPGNTMALSAPADLPNQSFTGQPTGSLASSFDSIIVNMMVVLRKYIADRKGVVGEMMPNSRSLTRIATIDDHLKSILGD